VIPPLGDVTVRGFLDCTHAQPGGGLCGRAAAWHVIWNLDLRHSFVCTEHRRVIDDAGWTFVLIHAVLPVCGLPGSRAWVADADDLDETGRRRSWCVHPFDDGDGLAVEAGEVESRDLLVTA